jgi:ABC-type sugar transport system ATPase subunit
MNPVVLQAENITKKFPGVCRAQGRRFDLRSGEIHGLCGENGAVNRR